MSRPRVAFVATVPGAVRAFVRPYLDSLAERYDVTLFVNGTRADLGADFPAAIAVVPIDLRRPIAPLADLAALARLVRHFRRGRFDLVHSLLPKAGLLAMQAARLAGVPHRLHLFTGQVWATRSGPMRALLKAIDRRTASAATLVMADSPSQRDFLLVEGVADTVHVIGNGSVCGIDTQRFAPDPAAATRLRERAGLPLDARIIGFVGRLNRDKGVPELLKAFASAELAEGTHLLLFGPDEGGMAAGEKAAMAPNANIHFMGPTDEVAALLPGMDLFCLPSHREGFGVSVLEASACGVPVVASRIYGLTDAVVEHETGWLVAPGDVDALAAALSAAMADPAELARRGAAGRERAVRDFAVADFVAEMDRLYAQRLGEGAP